MASALVQKNQWLSENAALNDELTKAWPFHWKVLNYLLTLRPAERMPSTGGFCVCVFSWHDSVDCNGSVGWRCPLL